MRIPTTRPEAPRRLRTEFQGPFPVGELSPIPFQPGVPADDLFPRTLLSRLFARAQRTCIAAPPGYADARGEPALRSAIAGYLTVSRGVICHPSQVFVTNGFAGALASAVQALGLHGQQAWVEDPGYPFARTALRWAGMTPTAVPVDSMGLEVEAAKAACPDASLALVTPGQHAPLGMTLSLERRHALIAWARSADRWILEDDYLGELQLGRHAAPALASLGPDRVLLAGTFSKTIAPTLRLGYLVVPESLVSPTTEVVGTLQPAPSPLIQLAVEAFMSEGHYLRHLRRMKRAYAERQAALSMALTAQGVQHTLGALTVLMTLPDGVTDTEVARAALPRGLAPVPLSAWSSLDGSRRNGLMLGVTNVRPDTADRHVEQLLALCKSTHDAASRVV